jgi:LuxR family maltose regulon positive regulatory protein
LERRRLLDKVRDGMERQVLLVQAPAGYGKTTLIARAMREARSRGADCVWLTVDASDGEGSAFTRNLARAVALALEETGGECPDAARAAAESDCEIRRALLARSLGRRGRRVALFLDDVHFARTEGFHHELDALLRALPGNAGIVLSGRARPGVSLSLARARGLLAELSAPDLAFTRAEVEALWSGAAADGDLTALIARCEGWAAPLQLALQLGDPAAAGAQSRPMHRVLREYIEESALRPLSSPARELLTRGSIANLCPRDLGEALAGAPLGADVRDELARLAPLASVLEGPAGCLRLHPLLREAVAADLERSGRPATVALHATAARWFGARGELEAAIHHAGAADDFSIAAEAIQRAGGVRLFLRLGGAALAELLDQLPPPAIQTTEGLRLARAVVLAKRGQLAEARRIVDEVRRAVSVEPAASEESRADVEHIDDLVNIYEDSEVDADLIAGRERALEQVPAGDAWVRGWIFNHLTIQLCRFGDLMRAQQAAHNSLARYREEGPTYAQSFMLIHLALIGLTRGRVAMALESAREAETLIGAAHPRDAGLRAIAEVPMAEALYARNDLIGARRRLDFALPVMAAGEGWVDIYVRALETRVRIAVVEEGLGAAIGLLDRGREIAAARELWRLYWSMDALRHEVMCRVNLPGEADQLAANLAREVSAGATGAGRRLTWRELLAGRVTLARGALIRNNPAAALAWLDPAITQAESMGAYQWVIPALILKAIAQDRGGDGETAFGSFLRAVAIAAPQGVLRPFIDEGRAMSSFVRQALRRFGIGSLSASNTEFVAEILSAASGDGRNASNGLLSEREHEILGLLNHGLANKEIARSIGLSEPTVKFHLKNLYGKLGVHSRTLAITVARQQRLLH